MKLRRASFSSLLSIAIFEFIFIPPSKLYGGIRFSRCPSVRIYVCKCMYVCLVSCLSVFQSACLSRLCMRVCVRACLSVCLSVCLSDRVHTSLPVCLSVCLSLQTSLYNVTHQHIYRCTHVHYTHEDDAHTGLIIKDVTTQK